MAAGMTISRTVTVGSPDEAANALFMTRLAETGSYRLPTGLDQSTAAYVHPRSMTLLGTDLASGSFLGLIQAGAVVIRVLGPGVERFLNPILLFFGLVSLFFVFRRFWSRWWALLGVTLVAIHPAVFIYATLPYLHNGTLTAGLMIAGWLFLRLLERPSWRRSALFGLGFGLALSFRPVEALWLAPAVVVMLVSRRLWRELTLAGLVILSCQTPWLFANRAVYGSWLSSGYTPGGVFTDAVGAATITAPAKTLLTPAGGEWNWHWLSSMWWYFILLLPAWSILSVAAFIRYFRRKFTTSGKVIKLSLITLMALFPFVYYGSWNLYPTTPSTDVGVFAGYVRYWLPLYVVMAPGVVLGLRQVRRRWIIVVLAGLLMGSQLTSIWAHPVSGLRARFQADQKNRIIRVTVLAATETNAVIIAGHRDKYFQDQRLSVFRLPETPVEWQNLQTLVSHRPVYLYNSFGEYDLEKLQLLLASQRLQLAPARTIGRDALFRLQSAT